MLYVITRSVRERGGNAGLLMASAPMGISNNARTRVRFISSLHCLAGWLGTLPIFTAERRAGSPPSTVMHVPRPLSRIVGLCSSSPCSAVRATLRDDLERGDDGML